MIVNVRRSALMILLVVAPAACSSSGGAAAHSATNAGTSTVPSTAPASSAPTSGAGSSAADPVTTAAVAKAYETFFNPSIPLVTVARNLQHGDRFTSAIAANAKLGKQRHLGVKVTKVVLISADSAAVSFDLLSSGKILLPDVSGFAAREVGVWKVAAKTFCELVALNGKPPAACGDPTVTELPG